MYSQAKTEEIGKMCEQIGVTATADKMGVSRETVKRAMRRHKATSRPPQEDAYKPDITLQKIAARYSATELRLLADGGLPMEYKHSPVHDFSGEEVRIGYMTDLHIGSVYTNYDYIREAREIFADADVDMIAVAGDITEGASHRPGHIYECSEFGFDRQKEKAVELLAPFDYCPLYLIDGNHDRWYIKSNGARIVKDICNGLPHAEFLGHDEGDIKINGSTVKLWHGEDASSYAVSYRLQKLVESFSGGEKPNLLIAGHVHKYAKLLLRNVHCISAGCIQKQSKWMRGKRIDAHTGFGIIDAVFNERGIGKITETFYPLYV